jgi:acylphosphatase
MDQVVRRFRITGKVQGVYFRHSARIEAERLKVRGVAQNLPDGSVDVVAQGEAAAVQGLRDWLHRGPKGARVDAVNDIDPGSAPALEIPPGFEVR